MVQILPAVQKQPSFGEHILHGLTQGIEPAVQQYYSNMARNKQESSANEAAKRLGLDTTGLDPETRRALLVENLKQGRASQKDKSNQLQDEESYGKVEGAFGKKFADLWKAAPVGGKTELLKQGIEAKLRGANIDQLLEGFDVPPSSDMQQNQVVESEQNQPKMLQIKDGKIPKEFQWPEFSKRPPGYTPKDWVSERKTWRKENTPVFVENKTKLQNNIRDEVAIKKLSKLNEKLPEGFGRLVINPSTGEPYALAQLSGKVSPEVQEWVKETARFQNRAKDSFGSRVTNFDLVSYMKQFPGLLNTKEGRKRILKMMNINNQLDQSYERSLRDIYQKYGLNGIPMEEADKLATSLIEDETEKLSNQYLGIDEQNQVEEQGESQQELQVVDQNGEVVGTIDASEVDSLPQGYRII